MPKKPTKDTNPRTVKVGDVIRSPANGQDVIVTQVFVVLRTHDGQEIVYDREAKVKIIEHPDPEAAEAVKALRESSSG